MAGRGIIRLRKDDEVKFASLTNIGYPTAAGLKLAAFVKSFEQQAFSKRLRQVHRHFDGSLGDDGWPRDNGTGLDVLRYLAATRGDVDLYFEGRLASVGRTAGSDIEGTFELNYDAERIEMSYHGAEMSLDFEILQALDEHGITAAFFAFERYADMLPLHYEALEEESGRAAALGTDLALLAKDADPYAFGDNYDDFSQAFRELWVTLTLAACERKVAELEGLVSGIDEILEEEEDEWLIQKAGAAREALEAELRSARGLGEEALGRD